MRSIRTVPVPTDGVAMRKGSKSGRPASENVVGDRGEILLLVASPERVFPVRLARGSELVVGRGPNADLRLTDAKVAPRHLALRAAADGTLEVEDLKSRAGTLLNDVQLSDKSLAHVGDQISIGDSTLLVLRALAPAKQRVKMLAASELDERLFAESERARRFRRPYSLLLLRSAAFGAAGGEQLAESLSLLVEPACTWGILSPLVRAVLCPEMPSEELAILRGKLAAALGAEGHRFAIGYASFPSDGADADCIMESALLRLSGQDPTRATSIEESLFLDSVMVRLVALVEKLARSDAPVLFQGERGSGKETLARVLHQRSGRSAGPFARVAGTALLPSALEGNLFGHDGDAVASAQQARFGALETASGGTVFIEHIGALPLATQAKLAQALELRSTSRIGSDHAYAVNVRIAASTEEDLGARVREGKFREDLHARLSAQMVIVPPLRDRMIEIVPLAELFLARCRRIYGRPRLSMSSETHAALRRYSWPGNVRELRNAIERASLISETDEIRLDALPPAMAKEAQASDPAALLGRDLRSSLRVAERDAFLQTLAVTRWNVTEAAKRLGLPRRTVIYRMSRLGLRRPGR